jgi:hypothetical protein
MLNDHVIRHRRAVRAANWALDGVLHAVAAQFNVKGIFLSASASDFYGYRGGLGLRWLDCC